MIELALAGAPVRCLFFGREELPRAGLGAHAAAGARAARRRARGDDGADRAASCTPAAWATSTRPGPSAGARATPRGPGPPTTRSSAPPPASSRSPRSRRVPHAFDGLEFVEVASVTRIAGGIAGQRDPRPGRVPRQLPLRARPQRRRGRGAAARAVRRPRRAADRLQRAVGPGGDRTARRRAGRRRRASCARPSRPGRRWPSSASPACPRSTSGRASPAQAHRRDESVEIAALVRAYEVLERFAR